MGLFNPVRALVIPGFCLITVPLAILAGITTTLAFSVLLLRVFTVYLDILLSLAPRWPSRRLFFTTAAVDNDTGATNYPSTSHHQRRHSHTPRRRRRSSTASSSSLGERGLGLVPSVGAERDFEGIGGWRLGGQIDDDLWSTACNPPLEMPDRPVSYFGHGHHHRSSSANGGPTTPGEGGYLMMKSRTPRANAGVGSSSSATAYPLASSPSLAASPNNSRARTPSGPRLKFTPTQQPDGYFALSRNTSPQATKRH
ncbi:hypothetical protein GMORB2_4083 [Geosmithia morbida]|uniref:Uncharacterized protein n=1 Tax=Geosmithia morbida TaxID=1094350 RepID=A0A9P4YY56_9HYPO|nr:uncharacterized protein GMORB2_4083 [Geosmithia morbida]KAF4125243.1 hypothetical protein GMORB2_4083 [Geosmithia morbida]